MKKIEMKSFNPELKFTKKIYKDLETFAKKKGMTKTALIFGYVLDGLANE